MSDRPNVLFVMSDQQRPDTMGFRGETPCRTPHMDRIVADPHETRNRIDDDALAQPLAELKAAHGGWLTRTENSHAAALLAEMGISAV